MIKDRISLYRLLLLSCPALGIVLALRGSALIVVGGVYVASAAVGAGLALTRIRLAAMMAFQNYSITALALCIWTILALFALVTARSLAGSTLPPILTMGLPNAALAVRSAPDIVVVLAVGLTLRKVFRSLQSRGIILRALAGLILPLLVVYVGWAMKMPAKLYRATWDPNISDVDRFFALFDLGNATWLAAVIPLCFKRELRSDNETFLLESSLFERKKQEPVLALLLVPLFIGGLLQALLGKGVGIQENMTTHAWFLKIGSLFLWTAVYEEIIYRLTCLSMLSLAARELTSERKATVFAMIGSSALFAAAHLRAGLPNTTMAICFGLVYSYVLIRSRNAEACMVAHCLHDTILIRWM